MKFICLICIFGLVLSQPETTYNESHQIRTEEGVIIVTDNNFDMVVKELEHILVLFYIAECGDCPALTREFEMAAKALAEKESTIFLGKLDAGVWTRVSRELEIGGYPTIQFFNNGKTSHYDGPTQAPGILTWIAKKTESPVNKIYSLKDLENKIKTENVIAVGFFTDEKNVKTDIYLSIATEYQSKTNHFYVTNDKKIMEYYNKQHGDISLFKSNDEKEIPFVGDITEESLENFIKLHFLKTGQHDKNEENKNDDSKSIDIGNNVRNDEMLTKDAENNQYEKEILTREEL